MDDRRLTDAHAAAVETERAIKFYIHSEESPLELASAWTVYRNVVGLRKALGNWLEMRAARRTQPTLVVRS